MKNSLITGLLALSIFTTVAPVVAATNHLTNKHLTNTHIIQHIVHKKTKHRHHTHKRKHSHIENIMTGIASWYGYESGPRYRRRPKTASGEYFSPHELTAAHKTLPFGTVVEVTNLANHQTVLVKINDRGPFVKGRVIDLSKAAAAAIGSRGIQSVSLAIKSFSDKYKTKLITI